MKGFRLKSILIVSALVLILGYNVYCLVELYKSTARQTRELITQSLRDADLDEVLNRSIRYPEVKHDGQYRGKQMSQSRNIEGDTLQVVIYEDDSIAAIRKMPLPPGTNYSDIMVNEIGYGAHQTVDPFYPLHITDIDSLFRLSLARKGIELDQVAVVRLSPDGIVTAGNASLRNHSGIDSTAICFNLLSGEQYVAYYSSPERYIFSRMAGSVLSSAALIILLAIAFRYLFRTVARLRTIEEMKEDFVSNMTHELKTPIAIAYSANDALLHYDADSDPARRREYLGIANRQLRRLSQLVESILSVSLERRRNPTLRMEPIELRPLIDEVASAQSLRTDKEIDITVGIPDHIVVTADRSHLTNVIGNLIDNAIKYSGSSVSITISGDVGSLSVADNGIGIPSDSIPYLFDKFYRVPHGNVHDVKGYGIGLYYVRTILTRMGWSIGVSSREGQGTVFTITYPQDEK